ncbi:MAG: sigma-E processing peptidase SpoIIGA [Ruminococcus sp.]|nr:sigma-E processing peptidase SpoIIGA [Ruminococcus sp.]
MQTIYVDILVVINMFEDFLLLLCVKYILRLNIKYFRIIAASVLGGLSSVSVLLPNVNFLYSVVIKLLLGFALSFIAFGYGSRKKFIKSSLTLIMLSFLFSGAMIFFYLTVRPNGMYIINDVVYFDISPVLLIILTVVIYFILFIYRKVFQNHAHSGLVHSIKILYKNNQTEFKCKTDSGCNVKEPFSGSSVIIAEREQLSDIDVNEQNLRIIPFESLGGSGIIKGFKADEVYIDGKKLSEEIYIGICDNVIKSEIKGLMPENIQ